MPDLRILGGYAPWVDQTSGAIGPVYYGAVQRAGAGALRTVPWAKAPVGPSLPTQDSGGGIVCPVCVSDDTLTFSTYPSATPCPRTGACLRAPPSTSSRAAGRSRRTRR